MSVYTTKISNIVYTKLKEVYPDSCDKMSSKDILNEFCYAPFDFDTYILPFKNGEASKVNEEKAQAFNFLLQKTFCVEYWESEIGFETVPLFKMKLNARINKLMYKLIPLIEAQTDSFFDDLIKTVDVFNDENRKNQATSESTAENNSNTKSKTISSETPDNMIYMNDIDNFHYADSASYGEGKSGAESSAESSADFNEDIARHRYGYDGIDKMTALNNYYDTVKNFIDIIINDCNDLFMGVWY